MKIGNAKPGQPIAERFWRRVIKGDGDGCWLWEGAHFVKGYAMLTYDGRPRRASRVSWELHNGPIPDGLFVCHHCDNPGCVRPDHLFIGTNSDNIKDAVRKGRVIPPMSSGRAPQTHCNRGHEITLENSVSAGAGKRRCRICSNARSKANKHYRH